MFQKKYLGQRIQISRHKQIVIAAIAVSGMLLYAFPAQQLASATAVIIVDGPSDEIENEPEFGDQDLAQRLVDETEQEIDQDADQRQSQELDQEIEQELEQSNEANIDQSEENEQANTIVTGDNTANPTQIGDNDAIGNALAAEAEGGSGGDDDSSDKYYKSEDHSSSSGGSGGSGEASTSIEQDVDNEFSATQDSSADDNVLVNENTFGDDIAVVDQDNVADQTAVNVGIQEQDQDINQYATNLDLTAQLGANTQEANLDAVIDCSLIDEDRQGGGGADVCSGGGSGGGQGGGDG